MTHRVAGAPLDFAALRSELEVPGTRGRHPAGADRVAEVLDAIVIDANQNAGTGALHEPAARGRRSGALRVGARIRVRLLTAAVAQRAVRFGRA